MVKPGQKQTDKSKKATSEELDLSLLPPLQLVEKKLAASTPAAKKKTDVPTGAVGSKTVSKRVAASTAAKKAADDILPGTVDSNVDQSVASVAGSHEDEDVLDHEIAEMEKSIRETQTKMEHLERASRVQSKKDKLSKMKARLEKNQQKLQVAAEKGEKKHSSSSKLGDDAQTTDSRVKAADLRDNVKLKKNANRKMKSLGLFSDNEQSVDSSSESSDGSVLSDSEHRHKPASKSHKSSRHYTYTSSESDRSGSSDSSESSKKSRHSHKNKKRSKKSGMSKRASDRVKYPQVWPHSVLQYEFVSEHVLQFFLFIYLFYFFLAAVSHFNSYTNAQGHFLILAFANKCNQLIIYSSKEVLHHLDFFIFLSDILTNKFIT